MAWTKKIIIVFTAIIVTFTSFANIVHGSSTVKFENKYHITYHSNNGMSETSIEASYAEGEQVVIIDGSEFTAPEGFDFMGWAETPAGPIVHEAGDAFKMPADDVNLYGVWEMMLYYDHPSDLSSLTLLRQYVKLVLSLLYI